MWILIYNKFNLILANELNSNFDKFQSTILDNYDNNLLILKSDYEYIQFNNFIKRENLFKIILNFKFY